MKKNSSLICICMTALIHVAGMCAFSFSLPAVKHPKETRIRIVTREVVAPRPSHVPVLVKEVPVQKSEVPVKKSVVPLIKKVTPAKKPVPTKAKIPSKQVKKKLEKALVKMQPVAKPYVPLPEKKPQPTPVADTAIADSYLQSVCAILEEYLTLPKQGKVKLTITVQANGKIGMVKEVSFESEENLRYLKEVLETLSFPPPVGGKEVEFTITFCGDA